MDEVPDDLLPKSLDDIDPAFMTRALRRSGAIGPDNEVASQSEKGVGMTAGYFSAIKKVSCVFKEPTNAPTDYVVKAWPPFELMPKPAIQAMFRKDIEGYRWPASAFYPRPRAHLAAFDADTDRWVLLMEDADAFAEHKVHEHELTLAEVLKMIPRLVDVAVAWEGADRGEKARRLDALGVDYWASQANLALYKAQMPGCAKIFDKLASMGGCALIGEPAWDKCLGPGLVEMFTRKIDAFFARADPKSGATCTISHGDLRGDNIFFCDRSDYPDGWLSIDFQLVFRGPVPSDLAYLMGSGSVLPEVYDGAGAQTVMRAFYDQFMAKTKAYPDYTFEQFSEEYAVMTAVLFVYYASMGAAYYQAGAYENAMGMQIELGGKGATAADLSPEDLRKRMWWTKAFANFRANFRAFDQYRLLRTLPENLDGLGPWMELPPHLV